MSDTTFVSKVTVVLTTWLQAVNNYCFRNSVVFSTYTDIRANASVNARAGKVRGRLSDSDGGEGEVYLDVTDLSSADNGGTVWVDSIGGRWKRKYTNEISPKWFGASGDGATDDTNSLLAMISALPTSNFCISFPKSSTYLVNADNINGLLFNGKNNFMILGNNSTIKVKNSAPVAGNYEVVYFQNCQKGIIKDLIVDANRANRTIPGEVGAYNFVIGTSCSDMLFSNCKAYNSVIDGFILLSNTENTLSTYPTDITLMNCVSTNSYRDNFSSICSVRCKIIGGSYNGAIGTLPEAGINFEPDVTSTYGNTDFTIQDVEASNNNGYGFMIAGPANKNVGGLLTNLRGKNNAQGLISVVGANDTTISGIKCGVHTALTRGAIDIGVSNINTNISDVTFERITASGGATCGIYVHSTNDRVAINDIKAYTLSCVLLYIQSGCDISAVVSRTCTAADVIVVGAGSNTVIRGVTIDTCTGRGIYTAAADTEIDGVSIRNASSTTASVMFDTGAVRGVCRNVSIYQATSIPVGAVAVYWNEIPKLVHNVQAHSAGTDYTATTIFTFASGTTGAQIASCSPHPFIGSVVWDPGILATGQMTAQNVTVTGAAIGDFAIAATGIDTTNLAVGCNVTAANTAKITLVNNSGGNIDLASSTWRVYVMKQR